MTDEKPIAAESLKDGEPRGHKGCLSMRCPVCRSLDVTKKELQGRHYQMYTCNQCYADYDRKYHAVFWHDTSRDEVFWPVDVTAVRSLHDNDNESYIAYEVQ